MTKLIAVFGCMVLGLVYISVAGNRIGRNRLDTTPVKSESWNCGQWVLLRVGEQLGAPLSVDDISKILPPRPDGNSMLELKRAFEKIGFEVVGQRCTLDELKTIQCPLIAKLDNPDHFVALVAHNESGAIVFDGAGGRRLVRWNSLGSNFSGNVLIVRRSKKSYAVPDL